MPTYLSHRQVLTRRNISRYRPAEEAAVGVGVVGVVVQLGEDDEKGGVGKWKWTRVLYAVFLVWFNAPPAIGAIS